MMVGPVEGEGRAPIVADQHNGPVAADHRVDEAPQKFAVGGEAVGVGTGIVELLRIAHADQVGRDQRPRCATCGTTLRHR